MGEQIGPGDRHVPTERERTIVENAAAFGEPHTRIAGYLGIDPKTLYKYYRNELDYGLFRANLKIGQTLFRLATESEDETVRYRACAFWASRRMGWTEKIVNVHTGPVQSINATMTAQEAVEAYQAMLRDTTLRIEKRHEDAD
jgi:hypothetical protein